MCSRTSPTSRTKPQSAVPSLPASLEPVPAEFPKLLSTGEVEAIFGRSGRALREWARKGRLRRVKIGHSLFYLADDVRQLIADGLAAAMVDRRKKSQRKRTGTAGGTRKKPL
jgi:hypothetical protein